MHRDESTTTNIRPRGQLDAHLLQLLLSWFISMADIQALLSALEVFSRAPEKASIDRANSWLQDFQHSVNLSFAYGQSPRLNSSDRVPTHLLVLA